MSLPSNCHPAPFPAIGFYAEGFEKIANQFATHLRTGQEKGAAFAAYHQGKLVVDLAGGLADVETQRPFLPETRIVVFSVTKGFAAMALAMLADRGKLDWEAPVATYWPAFAKNGKDAITMRTLFSHRAGLAALDTPLTLEDCLEHPERIEKALEDQKPETQPKQAYHAITFGMLASAVFKRIAGETIGTFLRRELFEPLGSDAYLGTPASLDPLVATLYPPSTTTRLRNSLLAALFHPNTADGQMARAIIAKNSLPRRAFLNPKLGKRGLLAYNDIPVRRAELAWASATASAKGIAQAYLPFSLQGEVDGKRYLKEQTLLPLHQKDGWSNHDAVLQKPIGWNRGFLKDEPNIFSPNQEAYGHAGLGGALGYCDPKTNLAFAYITNHLDWQIRSPRTIALCQALYQNHTLQTQSQGGSPPPWNPGPA